MFFFEKKNQKTFGLAGVCTGSAFNRLRTEAIKGTSGAHARKAKSFCALFSKSASCFLFSWEFVECL